MTTTKTPTEVRDGLLADMRSALEVVRDTPLQSFVVAYIDGGEPMRLNDDGRVGLIGKRLYSTRSRHDAQRVADGLNTLYAQARSCARVAVERTPDWRIRRQAKILDLIETLEAMAV